MILEILYKYSIKTNIIIIESKTNNIHYKGNIMEYYNADKFTLWYKEVKHLRLENNTLNIII